MPSSPTKKPLAIAPDDADVHLNLANAYLSGGAMEDTIREADEVPKSRFQLGGRGILSKARLSFGRPITRKRSRHSRTPRRSIPENRQRSFNSASREWD
jgi:hypothetical protein